jgi:hypothetical protein
MKSPSITSGESEKVSSGWFRGVNSIRNPWLLDDAMYPWAVNTVNRGGIVQTRPGYRLALSLPPGNFQGFEFFTVNKETSSGFVFQGGRTFLVAAVDGKIYASSYPFIQPADAEAWEARRLRGIQFDPEAKQVVFCVAEKSTSTIGGDISLSKSYSVLVMQDGISAAAYWDGERNEHTNENSPNFSTPTGLWMSFSGNRLWVGRGNTLIASNLLDPLGFNERLTQGTFQGDYKMPADITGMVNTIGENRQSNLVVFTQNQTFNFLSYIPNRNDWQETQNFQTTLFPSLGCVAGLSIVNHAGLLWWYSSGGLVSSDSATTAFLSSRIKYRDVEMAQATSRLWEDLSGICSASFESYLLVSVPVNDVFNSNTMVLDYATADEMVSDEVPAWQGVWTGTRPIKWATPIIEGTRLAFQGSVDYESLGGSHNHIWQAFQSDRTDSYDFINSSNALETRHNPIYCSFETKLLGDGLDLKVFKYAKINLAEISGDVNFKCSYRGTRGGYKEILNTKFIAITEAWQTTNREILDMIESGVVLVPQSRSINTEVAEPLNNEIEDSAESKDDETIDRYFSLYCQWCGRAGVESVVLTMQPAPERSTGECVPGEEKLSVVTQDGTSYQFDP